MLKDFHWLVQIQNVKFKWLSTFFLINTCWLSTFGFRHSSFLFRLLTFVSVFEFPQLSAFTSSTFYLRLSTVKFDNHFFTSTLNVSTFYIRLLIFFSTFNSCLFLWTLDFWLLKLPHTFEIWLLFFRLFSFDFRHSWFFSTFWFSIFNFWFIFKFENFHIDDFCRKFLMQIVYFSKNTSKTDQSRGNHNKVFL